ncbi:MAG: hypothetical protein ABI550_06355 [Ignavibacteriaceae bacterium]
MGEIKTLSGFKKGYHTIPTEKNYYTEKFVSDISEIEIKDVMDEIYKNIKTHFNYKRKELDFTPDRIITPDFEVKVIVVQSKDDLSEYSLRVELSEFTSIAILESEELNGLFNSYFDTIELEFNNNIDIEDLIDIIEEIDSTEIKIDYPSDYSYVKIKLEDINKEIVISEYSFKIISEKKTKPLTLLRSLISVKNKLAGYNQLKMLE